jgi:hypothetical protein
MLLIFYSRHLVFSFTEECSSWYNKINCFGNTLVFREDGVSRFLVLSLGVEEGKTNLKACKIH